MRELPRGWEWKALGDLGSEVRGSVKPAGNETYELYSVPTFPTGKPEVLKGSDIGSNKRPVEPGDLLLCKINPRINRVWIVGQALGVGPQLASTEYLVLRVRDPSLAGYLMWYLRSPAFREWIKLAVEGATGSHTRAKSKPILEQLVPVAPIAERQRIVAAVEEYLSRLEAAESALLSARSRLDLLGDLTFSPEYANVPIGDVAEVFVGTTPPRSDPTLWGGPIPWVSSGEVAFCRISGTRETIAKRAVSPDRIHPPGTVLLAMIGEGKTRGQAALLDVAAAHNQNSAAIRPNRQRLLPEWLYYVLRARYLETRRLGSGNNQPALNKARVSAISIPLPPLDVQEALVKATETADSRLQSVRDLSETAVMRAASLRRAVLRTAFLGQLVGEST